MKSRYLRSAKAPTLMLTSLLDMFTIILIFLIVSFEAESQDLRLSPDIELPESAARAELKPAVNMAITPAAISVEEADVVPLKKGKLAPEAYDTQELPALTRALQERYEQKFGTSMKGAAEEDERGAVQPVVVVQADKSLDYRTLYVVLRAAAEAGFFKYRLVILKA